jgi:site-specific DNA recombinase
LNRFIRDEGQSGKSMARNGLSALLAEVSAQRIGTVIVLKLDRLTRSVHDLAELLALFAKADCALISVSENVDTSSASGRLLLNLLASVSQWEAEAISERTSIALRYKKSQGLVYGRTPFGFIRDGARLVRDPESQAVLREIQDMHMKHGMTLRAIARQLNEHGVRPSQGGTQWYASSVRSVLKSSTWL